MFVYVISSKSNELSPKQLIDFKKFRDWADFS